MVIEWSGEEGQPNTVEVRELPGGQVLQQFTWPDANWPLEEWDGEQFSSVLTMRIGHTYNYIGTMRSFRPDDVRDESLHALQNEEFNNHISTYSGHGWFAVANDSMRLPTPVDRATDWIAALLKCPRNGLSCQRWQFYDAASSRPRGSIIHVGGEGKVSPNGRLLAVTIWGGDLELWDTDPRSRWPFAALAGIVASLPALLVGRWRSKR